MLDKRSLTLSNLTYHRVPVDPVILAAITSTGTLHFDTTLQDYRQGDNVLILGATHDGVFTGVELWAKVTRIGFLGDTNNMTADQPVNITFTLDR